MTPTSPRILLVDDDELNLDVLVECLKDEPYELVQAHNGEEALAYLREDGQDFHAMVLDRMMPGMNGLDLLAHLKADELLQWLPVVMQTAAGSPQEIGEGIEAGVFFYLIKPFDQRLLLRIVNAAVEEGLKWKRICRNLNQQSQIVELLQQGRFHVRTMEEAYDLAFLLGRACPNSEKVVFGLNELLANGVEHGNLGIGFDEKTALQTSGTWEKEIQRRAGLPEYVHKVVDVLFERCLDCIRVTITDQGSGFDWRKYEQIDPDRILESHGRGIAMAKALSFSRVEYRGNGNQVVCIIKTDLSIGEEVGSLSSQIPMAAYQSDRM
ncbi:response regulator [Candidatus Nitrospira neomarina]|uniref:Response regulator n=1 Tax=Candidatus Nitrospira neomarina TaxID=3020899 RepID=A0AA96GIX5_9BACT|nr:response regulator [Candidatus Nitrospira neomarina]WNM62781.1 response regulator [Candidatus Nitrospira neomarina]